MLITVIIITISCIGPIQGDRKLAVARNRTQDTWLELPLTYNHYMYCTGGASQHHLYLYFLGRLTYGLPSAQWHTINFLPPVNCGILHAPENGIIENMLSISTVGSAQIFFRCNSRYVPAGRMSATCISPDGISAVGTWTPDPADLVCNGEI